MKNNSHAFVNQLLVCLLVTIGFGGSVGLGTVWMRHQISMTANTNRKLEAQVIKLERSIADVTTAIESEQSPELLRQLNDTWALGLVPVTEAQKIHVTEDPVRRLAARGNRELFGDPAAVISLRFSFAQ